MDDIRIKMEIAVITIDNILEVEQKIDGLKAVIFDMDDTLYSEKDYVRNGYREITDLFPNIKDAEKKLWSLFESKKPAIDEFLKEENIYSEEIKEKCLQVYRYQTPRITLYDGIKEMLIRLKEKDYFLGMITDGRPEGQNAKIEALEIRGLFEKIIITDELGGISYRKPNETSFRIMKEYLGVAYSDMGYVGDNLKKDFIAPEKLEMESIWFRNKDGLYNR